jgi:hypothetical protein
MCLTQTQNAAPIAPPSMTLPGSSGQDPNMAGGDTGPNSLGAALDSQRTPQPASIKTPTKMGRAIELATGGAYDPTGGLDEAPGPGGRLTKYGALARVIGSMMQGGAIGGFMGKSTTGGGFAAANNAFLQRRMMQMQQYQLAANAMKLQSQIQKNQAEAQWAQRRPMVTRTAPAIKGQDDQGNPIFMEQDPQDGQFKPVSGIHPEGDPYQITDTDQGKVLYNNRQPRVGAIPLTMSPQVGNAAVAKNNPAEGSDESASEPSLRAAGNKVPTQFDSGSPRVPSRGAVSTAPSASPGAISSSGIPQRLYGAGFNTPKSTKVTNRDAAGNETDNFVDDNPNSATYGQTIRRGVASRAPLPDRTAGRENTRDAQKASDTDRTEQYAAAALAKSGGDPDKAIQSLNGLKIADPNAAKDFNRLLPQIRKSITDRAKQRRPKAKPTNSLGISDAEWQQMTGGQPAPNSNDQE